MKNTKTIAFILLGLTWLTTVALRGLAIPVMARFEIGDPIVGFMSASAMVAIVLGVSLYTALMRNTKDETVTSTVVVVGVTLFIATALGLYDYVWAEVTQVVLYTAE